jgi:hypothetical protein
MYSLRQFSNKAASCWRPVLWRRILFNRLDQELAGQDKVRTASGHGNIASGQLEIARRTVDESPAISRDEFRAQDANTFPQRRYAPDSELKRWTSSMKVAEVTLTVLLDAQVGYIPRLRASHD